MSDDDCFTCKNECKPNNTVKKELKKCSYVLDNDMTFPKATVDPKLIKLQSDITVFVTSVILKHEKEFYKLVNTHFAGEFESILGNTTASIISMISETTNQFYNKLYFDIQNSNNTNLTKIIMEMCELVDYGPHILLDKLLRLTLEIHLDVVREQLAFTLLSCVPQDMSSECSGDSPEEQVKPEDNACLTDKKYLQDYDLYEKSVLMQINICLLSLNLLHIFSKGDGENGPFVVVPSGEKPFDIVIDKNINN